MIVLYINVLSEVLLPRPDARVLAGMTAQPATALFAATITCGEIFYGIRLLPKGRRRDKLQNAVTAIFDEDFSSRILVLDNPAADAYAGTVAARKKASRPIGQLDAIIAAVAHSRGAALATRNTRTSSIAASTRVRR